ncbi:MAG TPA: DMT family transporter [Acidimicrobiales bacterium]|nr:DMT family transporter [Acidimicrobiales bacterium]
MKPTQRAWRWPYLGIGLAWGCSFLFIKESLGFLTPFGVAFARCALGATTLFVILRLRRLGLPRQRQVWLHLGVNALCLNVVPGVLFAVAETRTTSLLAGIINALTPLTSLFFIALVFRDDPVSPSQTGGLILGLVGVCVVLGLWHGIGSNPWWAIAALLFSVTLYGFSFPYTRRYLSPLGLAPVSLASAQLLMASALLAPTFVVDGLKGSAPTLRAGMSVLALGVVGSGLAFFWNFRVIATAGSQVASTVTYLTPIVAVVVGVSLLHESLQWNQPVGGLVVLVGAALGQGRLSIPKRFAAASRPS